MDSFNNNKTKKKDKRNKMTIVITGATGTVGRCVVESLLRSKARNVRLLVRDESKARELFKGIEGSEELTYFVGDVTDLELVDQALFQGVERLFVLTPSNLNQRRVEHNLVKTTFDHSSSTLKQVVKVGALGSSINSDHDTLGVRSHAESENALMDFLEDKKVALVTLRPNLFLQNCAVQDANPIKYKSAIFRTGAADFKDHKISHVDVRDIGDAAAWILTGSVERTANRTYNLTGPETLTNDEFAERASAALGKKIVCITVDDYTMFNSLHNTLKLSEDMSIRLIKLLQSYRIGGMTSLVCGDFQILTGKKPRSVEQYFAEFKHLFE